MARIDVSEGVRYPDTQLFLDRDSALSRRAKSHPVGGRTSLVVEAIRGWRSAAPFQLAAVLRYAVMPVARKV